MSRRVWIEQGYFRINTGLYVVLVAPPAGKKTTAMSICRNLIQELNKGGGNPPPIPLSSECVTKEAIVGLLKTTERTFTPPADAQGVTRAPEVYCPLTICVTELSEFIGASNERMVGFLTDVYDQDVYAAHTIKRGIELIYGPHLVLLGCTTPAWITMRLKDDVISGGFTSRALFIYEGEPGPRIARPIITTEMKLAWDRALDYGRKLLKVNGQFMWSQRALKYYDDWYYSRDIPQDPMLVGYHGRKPLHLLKLAMLDSLSESPELMLQTESLERAMDLLALSERNLPRVFEGIGRNELNAVAAKMVEIITQAGGALPEKKVYSMMFADGQTAEIRQCVEHLVATERLFLKAWKKKGSAIAVPHLFTPTRHTEIQFLIEQENKEKLPPT